jgi:hypothetical protein
LEEVGCVEVSREEWIAMIANGCNYSLYLYF